MGQLILQQMLRLKNILLYQFKNYVSGNYNFERNVIGISGNNGLGKTNLLDAIYYLCFTKSYFSKNDGSSVYHGLQGMRIEGNFEKNRQAEKIVCIIRENNKKEIQRNGFDYKRFSAHIGQFPAVMIAPDDVELITGTSEVRRKFIDTLLSQLNEKYLSFLIEYNKVLQQRNSFLKAAAERNYVDEILLEILNRQLADAGTELYKQRKNFLNDFLPKVEARYHQIAGTAEQVKLNFCSQLDESDFGSLLQTFKPKDLMLQRSTIGIHKDDIEITLGNEGFKNTASQGQRKSLLFAFKLLEFEALKNAKGFAPILLLDDVFEKLDAHRMHNLLFTVCVENEGQVFITDTHKDRLQKALQDLQIQFQLIELNAANE